MDSSQGSYVHATADKTLSATWFMILNQYDYWSKRPIQGGLSEWNAVGVFRASILVGDAVYCWGGGGGGGNHHKVRNEFNMSV